MAKGTLNYFQEWFAQVPGRLYTLLGILIPLIGGGVVIVLWLISKGLEWWWAILYLLFVMLFVIYSFFAFMKVAKVRDELQKKLEEPKLEDDKLRESRIRIRSSIDDIPKILDSLRIRIIEIAKSISLDDIPKETKERMYTELFGSFGININLSDIEKMVKNKDTEAFSKLMGQLLKSSGMSNTSNVNTMLSKFIEFSLKIEGVLGNAGINIQKVAMEDGQFSKLLQQLKEQQINIYSVELNKSIDSFIIWLYGVASYTVLGLPKNTSKEDMEIVPIKFRFAFPLMQKVLDVMIDQQFSIVKKQVEDYQIGK